jgi:hypothetical protein
VKESEQEKRKQKIHKAKSVVDLFIYYAGGSGGPRNIFFGGPLKKL